MNISINLQKGEELLQLQDVPKELALKIVEGFYSEVKAVKPAQPVNLVTGDNQVTSEVTLSPANQLIQNEKGEMIPAFWKTGIKEDPDGTKRYKCRYFCECGNQGNHYIPLGTEDVECHKCNYLINVGPAGKPDGDGAPKRDTFGNFFTARAGAN